MSRLLAKEWPQTGERSTFRLPNDYRRGLVRLSREHRRGVAQRGRAGGSCGWSMVTENRRCGRNEPARGVELTVVREMNPASVSNTGAGVEQHGARRRILVPCRDASSGSWKNKLDRPRSSLMRAGHGKSSAFGSWATAIVLWHAA